MTETEIRKGWPGWTSPDVVNILAAVERLSTALSLLRAWNYGSAGYSASLVVMLNKWIDDGMQGPIPWPDSPFVADWAIKNGYSRIDGSSHAAPIETEPPTGVGGPAKPASEPPFQPDWSSPPGDTIREIIDERGLERWRVALNLSLGETLMALLLDGYLALTPQIADRLAATLGASPEFWLERERRYREAQRRNHKPQQEAS